MREIRPSGSEGGARFKPLSLPLFELPADNRFQLRVEAKAVATSLSEKGARDGRAVPAWAADALVYPELPGAAFRTPRLGTY